MFCLVSADSPFFHQDFHSSLGRQHSQSVQLPLEGQDRFEIEGLEKMVEELYLDYEVVFYHNEDPSSTSALRIEQQRIRDRAIEITATTIVPCSTQEASAMLWRDSITIHHYSDKSYRFRQPSSVEKNFVLVLQSSAGALELNGFTFIRKIEEPNRVVLVEAARILLVTGGLQFRMQRWTTITRLEAEPRPSSVVCTLLQLHAEYTGDFTGEKEQLRELEAIVMEMLSQRMQNYIQQQQEEIVQKAVRFRMSTAAGISAAV
ncbi:unnamed protein product [Phytophthora fragariaefolia]|uniref:Unnamed protein product n=1 Tax=Phytophthora fragariaefolia TaxID=1490495 RepID=A0A9W6XTW6_9STRA|nr:unnamed protein product [Phytophthora fragariaefolia]